MEYLIILLITLGYIVLISNFATTQPAEKLERYTWLCLFGDAPAAIAVFYYIDQEALFFIFLLIASVTGAAHIVFVIYYYKKCWSNSITERATYWVWLSPAAYFGDQSGTLSIEEAMTRQRRAIEKFTEMLCERETELSFNASTAILETDMENATLLVRCSPQTAGRLSELQEVAVIEPSCAMVRLDALLIRLNHP